VAGDRVAAFTPNLPETMIACWPPPAWGRPGLPAHPTSGCTGGGSVRADRAEGVFHGGGYFYAGKTWIR